MAFTSLTFVLFLVVVFAADWALRHRTAQSTVLVAPSLILYGWWHCRFCGLMLVAKSDRLCGRATQPLELSNLSRPLRWPVNSALVGITLFAGTLASSQFVCFQSDR